MISKNSNFKEMDENNYLGNLTENKTSNAEEINWLIDNLPVTVFRTSSRLSWGMDYISKNVEKLTGYSKTDFIDHKLSWTDIVLPEDIKVINKAVQKAKKNKSSYQIEYRIKKSNGSTALVQEQSHIVCDDNGKPAYITGIFLDLTSEIKRRDISPDSIKEDEKIRLEMFQSFVEKISSGEKLELISGNFTGGIQKTVDLINHSTNNITGLLDEMKTVSKAGEKGLLDVRANDSKYPGEWGTVLKELNYTLDSVINPLNVAAEYIERISRGNIPEPITDNYKGSFSKIKNNMNNCIEGLQGLEECNNVLQRMIVDNDLTKCVEGNYIGLFASMAKATNNVRDRMLLITKLMNDLAVGKTSELVGLRKVGKRSEHDEILPAFICTFENIDLLVKDTEMLSKAAVEGKLDTRADTSRHSGEYKKVVDGVNDTLDAVIGPLNVAAEYVERISRGDIPEHITENYNGDFNEIKNNLNACIDGLQGLVECNNVLQRMAVNDLTESVECKYVGVYASMGEATNLVREHLLSITGIMNEISVGDTSRLESLNKIGKRSVQDKLLPAIIGAMESINLLIEDTEMLSKAGVEGKLDIRADVSRHQGEYRKIVGGVNDTLDAVIGPLNVAAEYVESISRGNIPEPITDNYNGDFNEIKNNLNTCIEAINKLVEDSLMLSKAGVEGRLDTRADASRHEGDFRKVIGGVNGTLDAVIGPLNVAAEYVERISRGDIPEHITDNYNGDFNEIKNNLNACIDGLQGLVECNNVLQRMAVNDLTESVEGKYIGVYASMGEATNLVREHLLSITGIMNKFAEGDTSRLDNLNKIGKRSEQDKLLPAIIGAMESINLLIEDTEMLSRAALEGKLDTRADVTKHRGECRKVVEGVNNTLDAVIGPLNVAAEYVERISRGDIPEHITDNYNGDFNEIKNNLNACIDGLQGLVECNNVLQRMAINDLTESVEGKYVGVYASMGEATNFVRDRLLSVTGIMNEISVGDTSRLESLNKIGKRSVQDKLLPAIIGAMESINLLIEDTGMLSRAAVEGMLDTRADASKHEGEYRKIIEGVNDTLDAVIGPLNVAAEYVECISRGDIPEHITDNYKGDFNEIKNNLNACIDGLQGLVECNNVLQRMAINDLTKRVEGDYVGIYDSMSEATNHVRDRLLSVTGFMNEIAVGDTSQLSDLKKIGKRSEQDKLVPAIIGAMENINLLIEDTGMLSRSAVEGKLDTRAVASKHNGEYRKIIEGINDTLEAFVIPIKSAKSITVQIAENGDEASRGADEVARAAGGVAMSSQKSSELTKELLYKIEGINKEIVDLSKSNEKIAESSKVILSSASEVVRIGKDAQMLGRDTNLKMESVEKIANESVKGIHSLTEQIKQIDGVLRLINDITSQINLLSLNAAIEAARAGEHGRGFAVVAGEVKNLATKARNATETIENVVLAVQRDSKKTADAINTANNEIIDGVSSVNKTLDALNTIIQNATQVTKDIRDITKAIEDQASISIKVVAASNDGNTMTQEVQREAEGLAAIAEETSASVQEIGAAIHEVTELSKKLNTKMEAYVV